MKKEIKLFLIDFIKKSKEYERNKISYKWDCPHYEKLVKCEECPLEKICENQGFANVNKRAELAGKILGPIQLELFNEIN